MQERDNLLWESNAACYRRMPPLPWYLYWLEINLLRFLLLWYCADTISSGRRIQQKVRLNDAKIKKIKKTQIKKINSWHDSKEKEIAWKGKRIFTPVLPHSSSLLWINYWNLKKKKKPVLDVHRTRSTQRGNPIRRYLVIFKVISICI